jgi:hypothetical protein
MTGKKKEEIPQHLRSRDQDQIPELLLGAPRLAINVCVLKRRPSVSLLFAAAIANDRDVRTEERSVVSIKH